MAKASRGKFALASLQTAGPSRGLSSVIWVPSDHLQQETARNRHESQTVSYLERR